MPSRRHTKSPSPRPAAEPTAPAAPSSGRPQTNVERDLELFAAALKEAEKAEKVAREREQTQRAEAARKAEDAAAHATALATAQRDLKRAVEAVRQAKETGRGRAEADAAWKVAKAKVIELETGTAPAWAPKPPPYASVEAPDAADDDAADVADEPAAD